jgi:hypothetical protein
MPIMHTFCHGSNPVQKVFHKESICSRFPLDSSDASPWIGTSGETLQSVKDTYANAIIVDDVNGFDNILVDTFVSRIEKFGLNKEDLDIVRGIIIFGGRVGLDYFSEDNEKNVWNILTQN